MAWLAKKLNMPLRSLYRSLHQRDQTYKGLLDKLRQELANQYLADSSFSSLTRLSLHAGVLRPAYSEKKPPNRALGNYKAKTPFQGSKPWERATRLRVV